MIRIGLSVGPNETKNALYVDWLRSAGPDVEIVLLNADNPGPDVAAGLDGIVLTGGGDVDPKFYGGSVDASLLDHVDERRDAFELALIDRALALDLPMLGICRGMQIVNVALDGTLIGDLPSTGHPNHSSSSGERTHAVAITPGTLLHAVTGVDVVEVNSFHHQAIDVPGRGLMQGSVSPDGIVESAEWVLKEQMPFLLLVQWHPERSPKTELSDKIAALFLREVRLMHHQTMNKPH